MRYIATSERAREICAAARQDANEWIDVDGCDIRWLVGPHRRRSNYHTLLVCGLQTRGYCMIDCVHTQRLSLVQTCMYVHECGIVDSLSAVQLIEWNVSLTPQCYSHASLRTLLRASISMMLLLVVLLLFLALAQPIEQQPRHEQRHSNEAPRVRRDGRVLSHHCRTRSAFFYRPRKLLAPPFGISRSCRLAESSRNALALRRRRCWLAVRRRAEERSCLLSRAGLDTTWDGDARGDEP